MNRLLVETTALPLYAQIAVQDAGTTDLPQWETGEEAAVASAHAVVVATRPDTDGDVTIRVIEGNEPDSLGSLVFEGGLSVTSGALDVGNAIAATVTRVDLDRGGDRNVRIFVQPPEMPAIVTVLIEPIPAG